MLRIHLNSSKSGVLYHFAPTVDIIYSILKNGLRTSSNYESHMRHMSNSDGKMKSKLSKKYAENPELAFVSLTRNPSIMPHQGKDTGAWRYGVIFSADKLSNVAKLMPYQYNTSNHYFTLTITALDDDPDGYSYSTDTSPEEIEVHSKEGDEAPLDQFLDVFYEMADNPPPGFTVKEIAGEWTIGGELTPEYPFQKLPRLLQDMLTSTAFESEERAFFPNTPRKTFVDESEEEFAKRKEDHPDATRKEGTRKAIIGTIFPDSEYWSDAAEKLRRAYPDYKMYVYRDPNAELDPDSKPVPKDAYRQPTA